LPLLATKATRYHLEKDVITYVSYKDGDGRPRQVRTEQAPLLPVGLEIDTPGTPGLRVLKTGTQVSSAGEFVQFVTVGDASSVPGPLL
jgi:hypothetical protein